MNETFEFYVSDSNLCREALAEVYVAFKAFRSTVDPIEKYLQLKLINDALAKVGYE